VTSSIPSCSPDVQGRAGPYIQLAGNTGQLEIQSSQQGTGVRVAESWAQERNWRLSKVGPLVVAALKGLLKLCRNG